MKLLIAVPALNEEQSIGQTIERCLAAVPEIVADGVAGSVEITVVSDGSRDRTVEIASSYSDRVKVIVFEVNRGYGAAIKEAWRQSDAELVGFLDADGTCDPRFFTRLCRALNDHQADIALGSRLSSESRMPAVRRFGNVLFALLLSALSSTRVRDTASGMRVVRRASLPTLYPLPDGLQFTPAMSARAMLAADLRVVELDMPYEEREGESKLSVGRDGVRFLRSIIQTATLFRPFRVLGYVAVPLLIFGTGLALPAVWGVVVRGSLPRDAAQTEAAAGGLLGATALLLVAGGYVAERVVEATLDVAGRHRLYHHMKRLIAARYFWALPSALFTVGAAAGIVGAVGVGSGRGLFSMVVCWYVAALLSVTRLLDTFVTLVSQRLGYLRDTAPHVLDDSAAV